MIDLANVHRRESLQRLLIPQIDLVARNPTTGQDVATTLSNKDASFVNGVFASKAADDAPSNADPTAAAAATSAVFLAAPFVVPGTALAFFPVGLVVTSIWALFFFLAVGLGTFGRIQFRDQYRRRMRTEQARGVRTSSACRYEMNGSSHYVSFLFIYCT